MAGRDANIIRLDSAFEPPPPNAVPKAAVPVRTQTIDYYRKFLPPLFDQADDTLFTMSGHATLHGEQSVLFDGMRAIRMQKQGISERFLSAIARWFEPGTHLHSGAEADDASLTEVKADTLSLVGDEDLEERLAIAGLLERVQQGSCGRQLQALNSRLASLYQLPQLPATGTPVGPVAAGQTFLQSLAPLELPLKVRLVIMKIFEQTFLDTIEELYRRLNNTLIEAYVLPDLEKQQRRERAQAAREANGCGQSDIEENIEEDVEEPPQSQPPPPPAAQDRQAHELGRQELMELLSLIQARQPEIEPGGIAVAGPSLRETMDIALAGTQGASTLNRQDDELIDVVSMLFEFILDDHELAGTIKALIGRLQVPVLKLAIMDRSFLNKRSHPARQLLNGLASAGVQSKAQGEAQVKRLTREVERIVITILQEFSTDIALFERALRSFEHFLDEEKGRLGRFEQRAKEAEQARERSEQARLEVQDIIDQQIAGRPVPGSVDPLLHEAWSSYLFLIYLKQGREGVTWQRAVHVVDHVVASVQPCNSAEEAEQRRVLLPKLYETLELGLQSISYDPCLAELYIKNLKAVHKEQDQAFSTPTDPASQMMSAMEELDKLARQPSQIAEAPAPEAAPVQTSNTIPVQEPAVSLEVPETEPAPEQDTQETTASEQPEAPENSSEPSGTNFKDKLEQWQTEEEQPKQQFPEPGEGYEEYEEEEIVLESTGNSDPFGEPVTTDSPPQPDLSSLVPGCEVEFHNRSGDMTGKLSKITDNGHYIFVNDRDIKIYEKVATEVKQDIDSGALVVLAPEKKKDDAVFDRALNSVIGNFRLFGKK